MRRHADGLYLSRLLHCEETVKSGARQTTRWVKESKGLRERCGAEVDGKREVSGRGDLRIVKFVEGETSRAIIKGILVESMSP